MYFFTAGNHTVLMFQEWKVTSIRGASGSFVAILALAVLFESVKAFHVTVRSNLKNWEWKEPSPPKACLPFLRLEVPVATQLLKTCLFVMEFLFAYFLMLAAMTYNIWFFLAVIFGRGLGYYLITPLVDSHIDSKKTNHYLAILHDSPLKRRKRQPLVENADV